MREVYSKKELYKFFEFYRKAYENDVARYGERYWKEKLIEHHGYLVGVEMTWMDDFEDERYLVMDKINTLELVREVLDYR